MNDISVIIPVNEINERTEDYFNKGIMSVVNQIEPPKKVFIVRADNENLKTFFSTWEQPKVDGIEWSILINTGETDFCSQINFGVESVDTVWFSILEIDDEYSRHWFKNSRTYIEAYEEVDIFLPLVVDVDTSNTFLGFTNESVWAMKFSEKMGVLDNNTLLNYQNYQTSGAVIRKETFEDVGMLKPSMKLTFIYEFLLRATYNDTQIMTIPRIGYKHANMREFSLFWKYKNDPEIAVKSEEAAFWVDAAKKEYFFTYDRGLVYEN